MSSPPALTNCAVDTAGRDSAPRVVVGPPPCSYSLRADALVVGEGGFEHGWSLVASGVSLIPDFPTHAELHPAPSPEAPSMESPSIRGVIPRGEKELGSDAATAQQLTPAVRLRLGWMQMAWKSYDVRY